MPLGIKCQNSFYFLITLNSSLGNLRFPSLLVWIVCRVNHDFLRCSSFLFSLLSLLYVTFGNLQHFKVEEMWSAYLFICDFLLSNDIVEKFPLVNTLAVLEEVEKDDLVELETLALVYRQTKHVSHESRKGIFALLVTHDHNSVTSELLLLNLFLFLLLFLLGRLRVLGATPNLQLS